jgi:hypothetical protein
MEFTSFPAALYRNGESRLCDSQEDVDAAAKDGWSDRPSPLPVDPPVAAQLPAVEPPALAPAPEQPIAEPEPPARPKKK